MRSSRTPICRIKTSLHLSPLTLSSSVLGYGIRAHPLGLNLMSAHSLGHQSSGFCFTISLSDKPKTDGCAAEDCSVTLFEIADELDDPPFGQLIAFSVLHLVSSHSGSLGGTMLLRGTHRAVYVISMTRQVELGDPQNSISCSFQPYLLHFKPNSSSAVQKGCLKQCYTRLNHECT
ncbi:hypothetical protein H5410_031131 [Solanum commersonii]|uniref:Uncharacterized protein n=1 Tax=Solanum commersonii TaxID=4109 RepID=A0A9J5YHL5_SOLCO|nr:hypothetical protein H5410_031131 [Solanum commersonii]